MPRRFRTWMVVTLAILAVLLTLYVLNQTIAWDA